MSENQGAEGRRPNRLAAESSPYLRQHALNPVDWYPWGEEAFAKAREEGRPIFLSIGYSSCHWCHVMERESFEDAEVARLLNERFVPVKVDREERPDVDDVYMAAVQAIAGRGGWPLSAWLTPDGRPFYGGTYFPKNDRGRHPGFLTLLGKLSEAWRERRSDVERSADELAGEVRRAADVSAKLGFRELDSSLSSLLTTELKRSFDAENGGFGGAPKFPPHGALAWLLGAAERGDREAGAIALRTLSAMALGGIHDHVGGGFHRYSTDERWFLPHFEKMLTDNALLLALYARGAVLSGSAFLARVARSTAAYLVSEMRGPEGAFYAATDADSEGEEGKYFVWTWDEVVPLLGGDGALFCQTYGLHPDGNFLEEATGHPTGRNVLFLAEEPGSETERRLSPLRARLKQARASRVPPGLDDKRIAGWNALAVSGLAVAGRLLKEPSWVEAARTAARHLLEVQRDGAGRLLRSWKDGTGKTPAFLEDEAYLAHALLDLADAERDEKGAARWRRAARETVDGIRLRFRSGAGFSFSGEGHEELIARGRDFFDKAVPSASGSAVGALVRVALLEDDALLAREAREALREASGLMARAPHGTESWHLALEGLLELERRHGGAIPADPATAVTTVAAESGPVVVTATLSSASLAPGGRVELGVEVTVRDGWHLAGEEGLVLEPRVGGDVTVEPLSIPKPSPLAGAAGEEGFEGIVSACFALAASPSAERGQRTVTLLVRFRPCGEGACEPERALSLSLPLAVGPAGPTPRRGAS